VSAARHALRQLALALSFSGALLTVLPAVAADREINPAAQAKIIDQLVRELERAYVFPDVAAAMARALRARLQTKHYEQLTDAAEFARNLTADLQEVSKDKHLRVLAPAAPRAGAAAVAGDSGRQGSGDGFHRVETLRGNIGYIDLRGFLPPRVAGARTAAAMNELADTDALIIDLRQNGGGSAEMVALLISYLVGKTPVHLNDFVGRDGNVLSSYWTHAEVPGRRYTGKDVYVLTSSFTFSAAEEFSYNLRNLERATLVGETTGGGANPIDWFELGAGFRASIPTARARNPITQTNWEGTGVTPHIETSAAAALKVAHVTALKKLLASGVTPDQAAALHAAIADVEKGS
jgi:retinol-binding protein 3